MVCCFISTTSVLANKIDKLVTDHDVERFLHKQRKGLQRFYFDATTNLYACAALQQIADSLGMQPWQKLDFDQNGLTDLFAYGFIEGESILIALMDMGPSFRLHSLNIETIDDILFPVMGTIDNHTCLFLSHAKEYCGGFEDCILKTDTLIYAYGHFIEPNYTGISYDIEKITYSTSMCLGKCPIFELEINADRTATYHAIQFNGKTGTFKTTIREQDYNALILLLNYTNFPHLKGQYAIKWTDDQAANLKITYNNGNVKEISDYGLIGTYGLIQIHRHLFSMRKKQRWKKCKS